MTQEETRGGAGRAADVPVPESWQWVLGTAARTVQALGTSLQIRIYRPDGGESGIPATVNAIRAFRAEAYYADGHRPSFRTTGGRFADPDDADLLAYHIMCIDEDGALVGCVRAVPADLLNSSPVEEHLGPGRAVELTGRLGTDRTGILEGGRLAVTASRRLQGVAAALMMVHLALARHMERPVVWGIAGEVEDQCRFFTRFGYHVLPGSSAYVPRYNENACVVVHDQRAAAPQVTEAIQMVERAVFVAGPAGEGGGGPG